MADADDELPTGGWFAEGDEPADDDTTPPDPVDLPTGDWFGSMERVPLDLAPEEGEFEWSAGRDDGSGDDASSEEASEPATTGETPDPATAEEPSSRRAEATAATEEPSSGRAERASEAEEAIDALSRSVGAESDAAPDAPSERAAAGDDGETADGTEATGETRPSDETETGPPDDGEATTETEPRDEPSRDSDSSDSDGDDDGGEEGVVAALRSLLGS